MPRRIASCTISKLGWDAAAQTEQVAAVEQFQRVAAQRQRDRQITQAPQVGGQAFGGRGVADRHGGAGCDKKARQRRPLPSQPQYYDPLVRESPSSRHPR
jgi:hypothetical protein